MDSVSPERHPTGRKPGVAGLGNWRGKAGNGRMWPEAMGVSKGTISR